MTISQKVWFPIWNEDIQWDTWILCWCNSLFLDALTFIQRWSGEGGRNGIAFVRAMDTSAVITLGGVQVSALGERTWLAVILSHMVVVIAPAAWVRARQRMRVWKRSWARTTPSGQSSHAWQRQRGLVIMHGLIALFLKWLRLQSSFFLWDLLLFESLLLCWGWLWHWLSWWRQSGWWSLQLHRSLWW